MIFFLPDNYTKSTVHNNKIKSANKHMNFFEILFNNLGTYFLTTT